MADEKLSTQEEIQRAIDAGEAKRAPKGKRHGLKVTVENFLEMSLVRSENYDKLSQRKQAEQDTEMRGFFKAQENLREIIVLGGTEAIQPLAEVRTESQWRPKYMEGLGRVWFG